MGKKLKILAQNAQSHQRRFRRYLSNRRIDISATHQALMTQALSKWGKKRLYLSLDTTVVWNCFCIIWVGVVYRGRTVVVAWWIVPQASSTVKLWAIQRVLRQSARILPASVEVVLLADRGFADGKLMRVESGHELSQIGLELGSSCPDSSVGNPDVFIFIESC